jgi:hypothetical protein
MPKTDLAELNPEDSQPKPSPAAPASHAAAEPSGPKGDDPSTAGKGETQVQSTTTENATGHLNPSAPEDANVTPGSMTQK